MTKQRIGILTYHRSVNYGAVMQSAALAGELQRRFPDAQVEIIDYCSARMSRYYKLVTLYRGRDGILKLGDRVAMYRAFQREMKRLPLTGTYLATDRCETFWQWLGDEYDILVTGSDAVWNYRKRGLPNPYFLAGNVKASRFSYAASCNGLGAASFDAIPDAQRDYLNEAFSRFSYIGTRDLQTERMVESVCPSAQVFHNCDPSLLLQNLRAADTQALQRKLQTRYGVDLKRPLIGLMLSNQNGDLKRELAGRLRQRYGDRFQTVSVYAYNKYADVPYIADLTPTEWSTIFSLFSLTISKYFHGTAFSLLHETPVIAVGAESAIEGLPNKIEDMLGRMRLMDLYFPARTAADIDWPALMAKIDSLLAQPPTERMRVGVQLERQNAESFFDAVACCLRERKG